MFCPNCGSNIKEGEASCSNCGTRVNDGLSQEQATNVTVQQGSAGKEKSKSGKVWGIVLLVIGILSFLGSIANGTFAGFVHEGLALSDIFMLIFMIGFIVGGICLISKKK